MIIITDTSKSEWADDYQAALDWTTNPPTVLGWYQVAMAGKILGFVEVSQNTSVPTFKVILGGIPYPVSDFSHWLGPFPLVDLPKGDE